MVFLFFCWGGVLEVRFVSLGWSMVVLYVKDR